MNKTDTDRSVLDDYIGVGEAARRLGMSTETVRRYADRGIFARWRPLLGSNRRILAADVDAMVRLRKMRAEDREPAQ